jgi:hypothetical protein
MKPVRSYSLKLPDEDPARVRRGLSELEEQLAELGTLEIPQLENGLFTATGGQDASDASGYQHAWLRDNAMVAYARWRCGDVLSATRTIHSLEAFLITQERRMSAIIAGPERKEEVRNRPHVRFEARTLREIPEPWAHAQNDALGDVVWLRLGLAEESDLPLSPNEVELLGTLARYFGAIEYWRDRDSGPWEEQRKLNSSSVGTVVAALCAIRRHRERTSSFSMLSGSELDSWIERGRETLARQLPFESPPERKTDAALLLLLHPLEVVDDLRIVSLVRARLEGEHGIRRYPGDSYFCQDYGEWFPPQEQSADFSDALAVRDELLRPGCEAQWCLFDPILSVVYGRRFRKDPKQPDYFRLQVRYLNRSLAQLTAKGQCAELYYLKGTEWIANNHTPLAWTQANLMVALHDLKLSLNAARV